MKSMSREKDFKKCEAVVGLRIWWLVLDVRGEGLVQMALEVLIIVVVTLWKRNLNHQPHIWVQPQAAGPPVSPCPGTGNISSYFPDTHFFSILQWFQRTKAIMMQEFSRLHSAWKPCWHYPGYPSSAMMRYIWMYTDGLFP